MLMRVAATRSGGSACVLNLAHSRCFAWAAPPFLPQRSLCPAGSMRMLTRRSCSPCVRCYPAMLLLSVHTCRVAAVPATAAATVGLTVRLCRPRAAWRSRSRIRSTTTPSAAQPLHRATARAPCTPCSPVSVTLRRHVRFALAMPAATPCPQRQSALTAPGLTLPIPRLRIS